MKCEVHYDRRLRRGVCFAPHTEGGGHYVRLPVWEAIALPVVALAILICWVIELILGES